MNSLIQNQQNQITVGSIHTNTEQTLIQITEDKLHLALIEHLDKIEAKNRWHVPLGVVLAIIPALLTSDFKDTGPISKYTWQAFFMFVSIGATIWLAYTLRWARASVTIERLIQKIKNSAMPSP